MSHTGRLRVTPGGERGVAADTAAGSVVAARLRRGVAIARRHCDGWRSIRQGFGRPGGPPNGGARPMYSRYLLTGLLRCAVCGPRMRAQPAVKRNRGNVYRAGWYRCPFAADKGPAVCGHPVWYRQDRLEGALIEKSREAMSPPRSSTR